MFKLVSIMCMVVLLAAIVLGCGETAEEAQSPVSATSASPKTSAPASTVTSNVNTGISTSPVTTKATVADAGPDSGQTGSSSIGATAKLPAKYPKEYFPIYDGSHILNVLEMGKGYTLMAYSKADHKDVIAFYEKVMANAKVTADTRLDTSFTSFGTKDGYTYTIDIGKSTEYKGYLTSIAISIY